MKKTNFTPLVGSCKQALALLVFVFMTILANGQTYNFSTGAIGDSPNVTDFTTSVAALPANPPCAGLWVVSGVKLEVTHTWTDDLDIYLVSPSGQMFSLSTDNGGTGSNGYPNVTLNMDPTTTVSPLGNPLANIAGQVPAAGSFYNAECLYTDGNFTAVPAPGGLTQNLAAPVSAATGTWTLRVRDDTGGDVGNVLGGTQLIFKYKPNTPATIGTLPNIMANNSAATPLSASVNLPAAVVTNPCGAVTATFSAASTPATGAAPATGVSFPVGTTKVTYTISDASGFVGTTTFNVIVSDIVPPTFTSCPANATVNLGPGQCSASYTFPNPQAIDNLPVFGPTSNTPAASLTAGGFTLQGPGLQGGNTFNITNTSANPLVITAVNGLFSVTTAGQTASVWWIPTTSVGAATSAAGWVNVANAVPVTVTSTTATTPIPLTTPIVIPAGATIGMAVVGSAGLQYNSGGTSSATPIPLGPLSFVAGQGINTIPATVGPFGPPRIANVGFTIATVVTNIAVAGPTPPNPVLTVTGGTTTAVVVPGINTIKYTATDAAGLTALCQFTVNVIPSPLVTTTLACNDNIQVSLGQTCTAPVTAAMLLKGGPYACFDFYKVEILNGVSVISASSAGVSPQTAVATVTGANIGQTLIGRVYDIGNPNNSCWGTISVEDKLPPVLTCAPSLTVDCDAVVAPATITPVFVTTKAPDVAFASPPTSPTFTLAVASPTPTAVINDLNVNLKYTTSGAGAGWIGDLTIRLVHPDGTTVILTQAAGTANCATVGAFDQTFTTTATAGPLNATFPCGSAASMSGTFKAVGNLAGLIGKPVGGNWQISITDAFGDGILNIAAQGLTLELKTIIPVPTATAVDGCDPAPTVSVGETSQTFSCVQNPAISKVITRTFTAKDKWGNKSTSCTQTISFKRATIATVTFPPDRDNVDSPMLDCAYGSILPKQALAINAPGTQYSAIVAPFYGPTGYNGILVGTNGAADKFVIYAPINPNPKVGSKPDTILASYTTPLFDANNNPHPNVTGAPSPSGAGCNSIDVKYKDERFDGDCANIGYKILRTWTVVDWCAGTTATRTQIIKVSDGTAPVIGATPDITVTTGANSCEGVYTMLPIPTTDNCSAVTVTAEIKTLAGVSVGVANNAGNLFTELPLSPLNAAGTQDNYIITYTATDACGNTSTKTARLFVYDMTAPTAVCQQNVKISLSIDGVAIIDAKTFDDGSKDNCAIARYQVKRVKPTENACSGRDMNKDGDYEDFVGDFGEDQFNFIVKGYPWDPNKIDTLGSPIITLTSIGAIVPINTTTSTVYIIDSLVLANINNPNFQWIPSTGPGVPNLVKINGVTYSYQTQTVTINNLVVNVFVNAVPFNLTILGTFVSDIRNNGTPLGAGGDELDLDANDNGSALDDYYYEYEYDNYYHNNVKFCCEDAGDTVIIRMKIWDNSLFRNRINFSKQDHPYYFVGYQGGNANECDVKVYVENKLKPVIFAESGTVKCSNDADAQAWLDTHKPGIKTINDYPTATNYGYYSNCGIEKVSFKDTPGINNCGVGTYTRIWSLLDETYSVRFYHPTDVDVDGNQVIVAVAMGSLSQANSYLDKGYSPIDTAVTKSTVLATTTQTVTSINASAYRVEFPADKTITCVKGANGVYNTSVASTGGAPKVTPLGNPGDVLSVTCPQVAIEFSEERFDVVNTGTPGACFKILRKWKVLNNCQFPNGASVQNLELLKNPGAEWVKKAGVCGAVVPRTYTNIAANIVPLIPNTPVGMLQVMYNPLVQDNTCYAFDTDGYMEYTQVIWVNDTEKPEWTDVPDPVVQDVAGSCSVKATIKVPKATDCTDNITYSYQVIKNSDNSIVTYGNLKSNVELTFNKDDFGSYTVRFKASDNCGNFTSSDKALNINDKKKPTPVCYQGLSASLMPTTGMASLDATQFDAGSYDNCTTHANLKFRIESPASTAVVGTVPPSTTSLTFNCKGLKIVRLWAIDEAGNADYCDTYVDLQYPWEGAPGAAVVSACPPTGPTSVEQYTLAGAITTEKAQTVDNVKVNLTANAAAMGYKMTSTGSFLFSQMLQQGGSYTVAPELDVNPSNGVSTFDLVLMSKHILNIQPLATPYQMIAADINKSKTITTFDMVELRKLILKINDKFTNNTSWRFVDKDFQFATTSGALVAGFPETKTLVNVNANAKADFIAVKVGDINGNAQTTAAPRGNDRNFAGTLTFNADDQNFKAGEEVRVTFKASEIASVQGYQFTMGYDKKALQLANIEGASENFGVIEEGVITTSWNGNATAADKLFTLVFRAKQNGQLSEVMNFNSTATVAEAYNTQAELFDIALQFNGNNVSDKFELFQNQPNPFTGKTTIGFNLPASEYAKLTIYDMTGRVLKTIEGEFKKGYNEVNVSDLNASGVVEYKLQTSTNAAMKKMIIAE